MVAHKQHVFQRLQLKRVLLAVCLLLAGYLFWSDYSLYLKVREAHNLRTTAEQELTYLEARKSRLNEEISDLSTPRGKEAYLRSQFLVGKQGEHVIIISGMESEKVATDKKTATDTTPWWSW